MFTMLRAFNNLRLTIYVLGGLNFLHLYVSVHDFLADKFNIFLANVPILYSLKVSENLWNFGILQGL